MKLKRIAVTLLTAAIVAGTGVSASFVIPQSGTVAEAATKLATPKLSSVKNTKKGAKFTWKSVSKASGYYVYRRKSGYKSWSKIAKVKGRTKVTYTDKKGKNGTTYYYSARAYAGNKTSKYNKTGLRIKYMSYDNVISAYASVVSKLSSSSFFELAYIDSDSYPELIVNSNGYSNESKVTVYTCYGGQLKTAGKLGSYGVAYFSPNNNYLQDNQFGKNYYVETYWKMSAGKITSVKTFKKSTSGFVSTYTVNGKTVTYNEYVNAVKSVRNSNYKMVTLGQGWKATSSNISKFKSSPESFLTR